MQSKHRAIPLLCVLLGIAWSAPLACAVATGVTINGRTDQVYDSSSGVLYFSTNNGTIQRYNRATNTLLPAWTVGVGANLNALDITPDHHYLFAVDTNLDGSGQGTVYRVDLSNSGAVSTFHYAATDGAGAFDIVALNDGRAVFSSSNQYSGAGTLLRSIDDLTGAITSFAINGNDQYVERQSELWRNSTHTTFALDGTNTSAGPISVFSTAIENYFVGVTTYTPLNGFRCAVSPDGTQTAMYGLNFASTARKTSDFSTLASLADGSGGFAFSPDGKILYDGSFNAGSILEYRTSDFQQIGSIAPGAGVDLFPYSQASNALTASDDGRYLFLYSANGLNVYNVPEPAMTAQLMMVVSVAALVARRRSRSACPAITANAERLK